MYQHKAIDHKTNIRHKLKGSAAKKSSGSDSSVINIVVSSKQYKDFQRANKGGIILNVISAGNVNSKRCDPFIGKVSIILK